jgi:hypothetical protein
MFKKYHELILNDDLKHQQIISHLINNQVLITFCFTIVAILYKNIIL